eukprot:TRINITY_DN15065_c0_g1_i3.p1 TRINITY_DN15065_c0_g1~~TRINITY_DN15065_c0_g1_i3.p1  ORF type:complete len:528 (-),score=92.21 TRINITY_DN15065_c0_g1_i3:225-1751(-)
MTAEADSSMAAAAAASGDIDVFKATAGSVILVLTLLLIARNKWSILPVGRTFATALGACLVVVCKLREPDAAFAAIDLGTLAVLLGVSIMVYYLERERLFELAVIPLLARCRSPFALLTCIAAISFLVSALFMNDPACLFLTPIVVQVVTGKGLPLAPYLIVLATSSNLGAAVTPIGSPQNMIIASQSGFSFVQFLAPLAPPALLGWLINLTLVGVCFRRQLATTAPDIEEVLAPARSDSVATDFTATLDAHGGALPCHLCSAGTSRSTSLGPQDAVACQPNDNDADMAQDMAQDVLSEECASFSFRKRWRLCAFVAVMTVVLVGFVMQFPLGWTCIVGAVAMVVLDRQLPDPMLGSIDGSLLLFFSGLFIVMDGFNATGLPDRAWSALMGGEHGLKDIYQAGSLALYVAVVLIGSNVMSNVPLVLLVAPQIKAFSGDTRLAWLVLSWVSTIAGNLTLVGSIANLIVAEKAKSHYNLRFGEYTRVGMPSTLLSIPPTVALLWLIVEKA